MESNLQISSQQTLIFTYIIIRHDQPRRAYLKDLTVHHLLEHALIAQQIMCIITCDTIVLTGVPYLVQYATRHTRGQFDSGAFASDPPAIINLRWASIPSVSRAPGEG